jgi:23S rRNA pseudouridine1911/1915/1917 synthase
VKQYRALIAGGPDEKLPAEGVLRDYLFKDSRKGRVFPVSRPRKGVKEAVLEYRISASAPDGSTSLADITLHTGRTHQIRVQFASRRHPLWGDGKYGSRIKGDIALQSARLRFIHPDTGKEMHQTGKRQWNNSIKQILKYTPSSSGRSSI